MPNKYFFFLFRGKQWRSALGVAHTVAVSPTASLVGWPDVAEPLFCFLWTVTCLIVTAGKVSKCVSSILAVHQIEIEPDTRNGVLARTMGGTVKKYWRLGTYGGPHTELKLTKVKYTVITTSWERIDWFWHFPFQILRFALFATPTFLTEPQL